MYEPVSVLMLELVGLVEACRTGQMERGERVVRDGTGRRRREMLAADTELTRLEYESNAAMGGCRG